MEKAEILPVSKYKASTIYQEGSEIRGISCSEGRVKENCGVVWPERVTHLVVHVGGA